MISKTCITFVSILSLSWLLSGCAQDLSSAQTEYQAAEQRQYELESYCSTKGYNISQQVTISDVTGMANHRDGHLMIGQD